jgi:hypothetical protein
VPPAYLAHLYREKQLFPRNEAELTTASFQPVLEICGWSGEYICNGEYIRFDCPDCMSLMFQPNTNRGIFHAMKVASAHKPQCCQERADLFAKTGVPAVWPDYLDE